ncbi:hypothetical protein C8R44DRAFT_972649 [Mycena epipterygia]|nr:hypothetical protein C8R44DRAFT_972649 [Mycena epipterygia]
MQGVAVDENSIGTIYTNRDDDSSILLYCHFNDNAVHRIPLGIHLVSGAICALYRGHFYIHGGDHDSGESIILCVRVRTSHSSDSHLQHDTETIKFTIPFLLPQLQLREVYTGAAQSVAPTYGVFAVTQRTSHIITKGPLHSVHFWPAEHDGLSHLQFGELSFYEHPFEMTQPLATGTSGRYAAIIGIDDRTIAPDATKPETSLGLVRYAAYPMSHATYH